MHVDTILKGSRHSDSYLNQAATSEEVPEVTTAVWLQALSAQILMICLGDAGTLPASGPAASR